jgi:deoxyribonuclease V
MESKPLTNAHLWDLKPKEAIAQQKLLSRQVVQKSTLRMTDLKTVAGVDTHYEGGRARAAAVTIQLTDLKTVDSATAVRKVSFPYIPGLLAFREGPTILAAVSNLILKPDLLMFDGQGIAHPRRCGLASHIGLLLELPAIGCAKTPLWGCYEEPGGEKGSSTLIKDGDEIIGAVVRTRSNVKPLFVSIGHRIDLRDCVRIVLQCCRRYRIPETLRRADKLARKGVQIS